MSSHVTGVLHTVRISTVEVIVSGDNCIKMANFERGNEVRKVKFPFLVSEKLVTHKLKLGEKTKTIRRLIL